MTASILKAKSLLLCGALALGFFTLGCAPLNAPSPRAGDQPFDEIRTLPSASANLTARSVRLLPRSAYKARWFFLAHRAPPRPRRVPEVVDPELAKLVTKIPDSTLLRVVITFADTVRIPRFPRLGRALSRSAPSNMVALDSAASIIRTLRAHRSAQYLADTTSLKSRYGARILDTFWLVQACAAEIRADRLRQFAAAGTNIVQVRLDRGQIAPQHDQERGNDIDAAIARIGSEPWYAEYGDGFVALLDTGVRTTHRLLRDPSPLCMVADCMSGHGMNLAGTACSEFESNGTTEGGGDTYSKGHGTSTAAILAGNGAPVGSDEKSIGWYRGVTRASLDCFQVYDQNGHVSATAVLKGFELALERLNQVVVAEMQENDVPDVAAIEAAADHAFDAGQLVIAANGNDTHLGLGVPARARHVIGVGCYGVLVDPPGYPYPWGHSPDGRMKPDLTAPSGTETAGASSDDAMRYHTSTSGATPYASGAALLLRNWLTRPWQNEPFDPDPGQVYALLMLSGDKAGPFSFATQTGVGRIRLPASGLTLCGKVWVSEATRAVDVPVELPGDGADAVSAALWWPETAVVVGGASKDGHNDVDLELRTSGVLGKRLAKSDGANGVFERVAISGGGSLPRRLVLRIVPYKIRTAEPQVVYWALAVPSPALN